MSDIDGVHRTGNAAGYDDRLDTVGEASGGRRAAPVQPPAGAASSAIDPAIERHVSRTIALAVAEMAPVAGLAAGRTAGEGDILYVGVSENAATELVDLDK